MKTLIAIVCAVFFQALLWVMVVPVWHFPDEQAHFAQVQNYAETGGTPVGRLDLSREIAEAETLLGTYRDERGNNQYTYNPTFRMSYTNTFDGEHEAYLKNLLPESRTEYVRAESPRYPPAYYAYSALFYRLGYGEDLFTRIHLVRAGSVILHLLMALAVWYTSKQLFPKSKPLQISLILAVAFHPMLMFVSLRH
jgi:hypothetical protein